MALAFNSVVLVGRLDKGTAENVFVKRACCFVVVGIDGACATSIF